MIVSSGSVPAAPQARHEWVEALCLRLERMILGDAAAQIAPAVQDERPPVSVLSAPVWVWRASRIDIGRKARRTDGAQMLMPVRISWDPSPVVVIRPGERARLTWQLSGLGHSGGGTLTVGLDGSGSPRILSGTAPDGVELTAVDHPEALISDGKTARWEALMSLEGYVDRAVRRAVTVVTADIFFAQGNGPQKPGAVLDGTSCEQVRDRMLLGTDEGRAPVDRLLDRCMAPRVFDAVDPLRYVSVDLQRTAEEEVRRSVDDAPKVGRKVRTLRRAMPEATIDEFLAEYRHRHPGDSLSWKRAQRALTASGDLMAGALRISLEEADALLVDDYDLVDDVIAHLEGAAAGRGAA